MNIIMNTGKILVIAVSLVFSGLGFSQNKPVIAVSEITTGIGNFSTMSIQLALENALQKTNKFTIMERSLSRLAAAGARLICGRYYGRYQRLLRIFWRGLPRLWQRF